MIRGVSLLAGVLMVAGCGISSLPAEPAVCAPQARTPLLTGELRAWVPSSPFVVAPNRTGWVQVTKLPVTAGGPFGQVGPVADLHYMAAGTTPRLAKSASSDNTSSDPGFSLSDVTGWQKVALSAGSWQVYSNTNPGIAMVSCPR